jgi:hypothetical protein
MHWICGRTDSKFKLYFWILTVFTCNIACYQFCTVQLSLSLSASYGSIYHDPASQDDLSPYPAQFCFKIVLKYDILQVKYCFVLSRSYMVLTMVYSTQNDWVFGLCPSSGF